MSTPPAQPALPPLNALYQIATGHYFTQALLLAVKLGIADQLAAGPRSAEDLAQATGTHAPSLRRVLRLLASVGVFEEREDGAFALTPLGNALRDGVPGSARSLVLLIAGERVQQAWSDLEYCVRTGNPVFRKQGLADAFQAIAETPEAQARFDEAMSDSTKLAAAAVAASYDFKPLRSIVDVGGGNGALLIGILKAHPHLRGTVFDQPAVAERARGKIAESGLASRCDARGGSFFEAVPEGADAYLIKHVIHDWEDERAIRILQHCRAALPDGGRVLIVEGVYPPRIEASPLARGAAANDVNMLVNTGGRQRSEQEFRALYAASGLALARIVPTPAGVSVIEGVKA
jgi:SAM-dependent methyltransferase